MPLASDIILDWIHEDGYSLSEAGWIRAQDRQFYFEVTAFSAIWTVTAMWMPRIWPCCWAVGDPVKAARLT